MNGLPRQAIALTAPELRALAGIHDTYAAASDVCCLFDQAREGEARAAELRSLADAIGPAEGEADALI